MSIVYYRIPVKLKEFLLFIIIIIIIFIYIKMAIRSIMLYDIEC